ncbi:MAG: long-chain fatty acid--CoA ligase, partial [Akkermansiaceae bacterium]|nr:long-chain fatty acid--CoA ligase [Akkermansiaceae bacterium]
DESLEARELIRWCRKSLSIYKVPVRVKFVRELPLTASGKSAVFKQHHHCQHERARADESGFDKPAPDC